ncbi:hypothetical protein OSB04_028610 [Centaurea solstitialis]|uniref:Reverse transcriptase domain-containing protein n=1 Tax=Centaurea solstitialis TaxID=347529 RepID=A0AA38W9F5_9ASTR|nr:hypothetical protein OSB04_028610 [Centaurea solstitialis]
MKQDVARYVESCLTCLKKPHDKMQLLEIPMWKWENITMDLITKLPKTTRKFDAIWVILDRLTKRAHFLAFRESFTSEQLADLYVKEVVTRHGVPMSIILNRDACFTSHPKKKESPSHVTKRNKKKKSPDPSASYTRSMAAMFDFQIPWVQPMPQPTDQLSSLAIWHLKNQVRISPMSSTHDSSLDLEITFTWVVPRVQVTSQVSSDVISTSKNHPTFDFKRFFSWEDQDQETNESVLQSTDPIH